jgi:hypothetical protein
MESRALKVVVIGVLLIALVVVVALGNRKQKEASQKWTAILTQMEEERKRNKQEKEETVKTTVNQAEPVQAVINQTEPEKTSYLYKGADSLTKTNITRWKNKSWYAFSDILTSEKGYIQNVKYSCSILEVTNDSYPERTMEIMCSSIIENKLKEADIVTVFGGTNDYSVGTPLGTINDDEKANTFYGSLHKIIKKILEINPDTTIVFFTPLKRGAYKSYAVYPEANNAGVKLEQYAQAVRDVCKLYNILVLDLFSESGINEKNIKSYTSDNLNLNEAGNRRLSKIISDYLKNIK